MTRPVLLAVSTIAPWPVRDGYSLRVANLLAGLASRWDVTLVAPPGHTGAPIRHVPIELAGPGLTYPWRFSPAVLGPAIARALGIRPDRVLLWPGCESAWLSQGSPNTAVMDMIDSNPLEFWHDVRSGSLRSRLGALRELGFATLHARRIVRRVAATVCAGESDAASLARIGGRLVQVVPNGVTVPPASELAAESDDATICFTGTLDFPPNVDAVRFLVEAIWPLVRGAVSDAQLIIAGRRPLPGIAALHGHRGIMVEANVPDLMPVISRAWVAIAPMRTGAGVKNKVLEAWSCGRPVVMTGLATNGLVLPPGHDGLIGHTAASLAAAVIRLLRDRVARRSLGAAAREHAERSCGWDAAVARLDRILHDAGAPPISRTGQPRASLRP